MIPHILTVFLFLSDGSVVETRFGTMDSEILCNLAAVAIANTLLREDPKIGVGYTCEAVRGAA